jgi:hypothetical protein
LALAVLALAILMLAVEAWKYFGSLVSTLDPALGNLMPELFQCS